MVPSRRRTPGRPAPQSRAQNQLAFENLAPVQKCEFLLRWRMENQFLYQRERCGQISQVKHLNRRVRVTTRQLDFERRNPPGGKVSGSRVSYATWGNCQLVWHPDAFSRPDKNIARRVRQQKPSRSGVGHWRDENTAPDAGVIGQMAGIGRASRWKCVDNDSNVWLQTIESSPGSTQPHFFLDSDQRCKRAGERLPVQAPQQMQQKDAACPIIDPFANDARSRQAPQLREDNDRIANAHTQRHHAGCIIYPHVHIEVSYCYTLALLVSCCQMTRAGADYTRMPVHPHSAPLQQTWLNTTQWGQAQKSIWLNARHCGADLICMCRDHDMRRVDWPFARGRQIAHVIYLHHICQWQKEVAQTLNNWLFGAGRRVQGCQRGQIRSKGIEFILMVLHGHSFSVYGV